jgi:hypothetical protein
MVQAGRVTIGLNMPDRLYLSCWVRGFNAASMLRHFEKILARVPFSKLASLGPLLRVRAIEMAEPPLFEREFPLGTSAAEIIKTAQEFVHEDCCVEVDAAWDLWQYDGDWKLAPTPVGLMCFGPEFENETGDNLHLVGDIERAVPVERRSLWSESGVNFAELLAEAVARLEIN